jgi:hypothetical protein
MRVIFSRRGIFIFFLLLNQQVFANPLACSSLFQTPSIASKETENAIQQLSQQALALSEKLAHIQPTFLNIHERILQRKIRNLHRRMTSIYERPPGHPGVLFMDSYFYPEFFWETTVNTTTGKLQTRTPILTSNERQALSLAATPSGVIHRQTGKPLTETISGDFVIGLDQQLYVHFDPAISNRFFRHSSFFAGGPVLFAGHIQIEPTGRISFFSAKSGHYRPSKAHFIWALEFLSSLGFTITDSFTYHFE